MFLPPHIVANMYKTSYITNITPLPSHISRKTALKLLHAHSEMISLNPLVLRQVLTQAPANATAEEARNCIWYEITDKISYLPGGLLDKETVYKAGFYDLPDGLQTHSFAPANVDLRGLWKVKGNMPGEPREPGELGVNVPAEGLYLREDVELKCNIFLTGFVKKALGKSHKVLVEHLLKKAMMDTDNDAKQSNTASNTVPEELVHQQAPCTCIQGIHQPLCPYYTYTARRPERPSVLKTPDAPTMPAAKSFPSSSEYASAERGDLYSPAGTHPNRTCNCVGTAHDGSCPYFDAIGQPLPDATSRTAPAARAYPNERRSQVAPQLFGEVAELPATSADRSGNPRIAYPAMRAELDGS